MPFLEKVARPITGRKNARNEIAASFSLSKLAVVGSTAARNASVRWICDGAEKTRPRQCGSSAARDSAISSGKSMAIKSRWAFMQAGLQRRLVLSLANFQSSRAQARDLADMR